MLVRLFDELYTEMQNISEMDSNNLLLNYLLYQYLIEKLSLYDDTFYLSKKNELKIIFEQLITDKKIFTAADVNSYYDYYMVEGPTVTYESYR